MAMTFTCSYPTPSCRSRKTSPWNAISSDSRYRAPAGVKHRSRRSSGKITRHPSAADTQFMPFEYLGVFGALVHDSSRMTSPLLLGDPVPLWIDTRGGSLMAARTKTKVSPKYKTKYRADFNRVFDALVP
jgi:hypothetical protein